MKYSQIDLQIVIDIFMELLGGYLLFIIISYLIRIPGSGSLKRYKEQNEEKQTRKEIKVARKWLCLIWTVFIILLNLYIIN